MQYANVLWLEKDIVLELKVYCYGVLRYTVMGDWDKLQELQDRGYYVQAMPALRSNIESDMDSRNKQFMSIENSHVFVDHDDGINKLAEERSDDEHYRLDFG